MAPTRHLVTCGVISLACVLGACTVDRTVPLENFACASGGPCDDGGVGRDRPVGQDVPDNDGGIPETGPQDVPPVLAECADIEALPADGLVTGDTTMSAGNYEGGCTFFGGRDSVYGFTAPGKLASLKITLLEGQPTSFNSAVHVYRDNCEPASRLACNDNYGEWNIADPIQLTRLNSSGEVDLIDVEPGPLAIVVDSIVPELFGNFVLNVSGEIAPGEPCDPQQTFLSCKIGECVPKRGEVARCPAVLDCEDQIDADNDGMVDEDAAACTNPPAVVCNDAAFVVVNGDVTLNAVEGGTANVVYREWTIIDRPAGSLARTANVNQPIEQMYVDLFGDYTVRYTAADDAFQLVACEHTFSPPILDRLRVELTFLENLPTHERHAIADLHLLEPTAMGYFDQSLDCSYFTCATLDWGAQGVLDDDPLLFPLPSGPQSVIISAPVNGSYGVGVEYNYFGQRQNTPVTVRIYCDEVLEQQIGPVILRIGDGPPEFNDFWRVAEVQMQAAGCTVDVPPALDIVSGMEAMMNRR